MESTCIDKKMSKRSLLVEKKPINMENWDYEHKVRSNLKSISAFELPWFRRKN